MSFLVQSSNFYFCRANFKLNSKPIDTTRRTFGAVADGEITILCWYAKILPQTHCSVNYLICVFWRFLVNKYVLFFLLRFGIDKLWQKWYIHNFCLCHHWKHARFWQDFCQILLFACVLPQTQAMHHPHNANAKFAVVAHHQNLHEKHLLDTKRFSILYIVNNYTLFI